MYTTIDILYNNCVKFSSIFKADVTVARYKNFGQHDRDTTTMSVVNVNNSCPRCKKSLKQ
jgi:NMD protein affecting ribosome stability and mRNA decay